MKAIKTKYLGPTDTRGSRIRACDGDRNCVTVPYPYEARQGEEAHRVAAKALAKKMGWGSRGLRGGWLKSGEYAFVFCGR
jgi:hypothetical protein